MKVRPFICNKNFPHDAEEFTFKEIVTHLEQCKSDIEIWVIRNIELANTQLDILLIKIENVVEIGGLVKFEDNPRVFTYLKAWMYFNEGSTYDYPQSLRTALNWFKVITMDTLCEEVTNAILLRRIERRRDSGDSWRYRHRENHLYAFLCREYIKRR